NVVQHRVRGGEIERTVGKRVEVTSVERNGRYLSGRAKASRDFGEQLGREIRRRDARAERDELPREISGTASDVQRAQRPGAAFAGERRGAPEHASEALLLDVVEYLGMPRVVDAGDAIVRAPVVRDRAHTAHRTTASAESSA